MLLLPVLSRAGHAPPPAAWLGAASPAAQQLRAFAARAAAARRTQGQTGSGAAAAEAAPGPVPGPGAAGPDTPQAAAISRDAEAFAKHAALQAAMASLNKKLGSGTIMRLGEAPAASSLECISSGCLTLDIALGGGWPKGRIVEVYGPESSGKSTLALQAIAETQRAGGQAVLVDAEHAFDRHFAAKLGVDVAQLVVCQPSCGEEALEVVDTVLRSHAVDLIAVDSVAALVPRAEQEGDMGMLQVASQARMMSQGLRKLAGNAARTQTCVLFVNQLRHKVGVLFGNPETTSGGNALKYYASQRVDVRVKERIKGADKAGEVGVRVKAKVVKNKVAPPYRSAEFVINFHKGVDKTASLLEAAELLGLVQSRGAHFYAQDIKLGHGRDAASRALAESPELHASLMAAVRAALRDPASLQAALARSADSSSSDDEGQGG